MSEEGNNYTFWNASTGDSYELQDVHSPLQSIGCIMNNENVSYIEIRLFITMGFSRKKIVTPLRIPMENSKGED